MWFRALFCLFVCLTCQGFELDFDPLVARLFNVCKDSEKLAHAVQSLIERYLSVEILFANKPNEDAVIADLIKAHKEDPEVSDDVLCVCSCVFIYFYVFVRFWCKRCAPCGS